MESPDITINLIPSLQDVCSNLIMHHIYHRNDSSLLEVYSFSKLLAFNKLCDFSIQIIKERYAYYLSELGESKLREILTDDFAAVHKLYIDRIKAEDFLKRKGSVVERERVVLDLGDMAAGEEGHYPLRALVAGVEWPTGVNPAQREQYLSPEEFASVFNMTKEKFNALDKHSRIRLKKEKKLF